MRNIKLIIEYEGTNYSGWQIQRKIKNKQRKTIQEVIEKYKDRVMALEQKTLGEENT